MVGEAGRLRYARVDGGRARRRPLAGGRPDERSALRPGGRVPRDRFSTAAGAHVEWRRPAGSAIDRHVRAGAHWRGANASHAAACRLRVARHAAAPSPPAGRRASVVLRKSSIGSTLSAKRGSQYGRPTGVSGARRAEAARAARSLLSHARVVPRRGGCRAGNAAARVAGPRGVRRPLVGPPLAVSHRDERLPECDRRS